MASLQEIKQKAWQIGGQLFEPIVRATAASIGQQIVEAIQPVSGRDRQIFANLTPDSAEIKAFMATQNSLAKVKQQRKELEEADTLLKAKIAREDFLLYRENLAQNWELAQQNLARQSELYRQERETKRLLSELWCNLEREMQRSELPQENEIEHWPIQTDWESSQQPKIFSDRELATWVEDSRRPLLICAKMQITEGCPDYFRTELAAETESQIKIFANAVLGEDARYYSRSFENEEIFEMNIAQLQSLIPQNFCAICWRKVTRRNAYFHYQFWGSESAKMLRGHLDIEVPWRELEQQLRVECAEETFAEDDLYESIGDWLIALQKLYALFAIELYALIDGENPFYWVKLGSTNLGFPAEISRQLVAPLANILQQIQERRIYLFNEVLSRQQNETEQQGREELQRQQEVLHKEQQEELHKEQQEAARQEKERQRSEKFVSARGMKAEYQKLDALLAEQQWRQADELTCQLMLRVANRTFQGWLNEDSIRTFPCEDLKTIDGLWVERSQGKFGFSVQKKMWKKCGGKVGEYDYEAYKKFAENVGWYYPQKDNWLTYNEFANQTENLQQALSGSLPVAVTLGAGVGWGLVVFLLSHRDL